MRWLGDRPVVSLAHVDPAVLDRMFWEDTVPGARIVKIVPLDEVAIELSQLPIRGQIFHMARAPSVRSLDYTRMPQAGWEQVAPHFGFNLSEDQREQMIVASQRDAKRPGSTFQADSEGKKSAVSRESRELAEKVIAPALLRTSQAMIAL